MGPVLLALAPVAQAQVVHVDADARAYLAAIPIPGSSAPEYFNPPVDAELGTWRTVAGQAWSGALDDAAAGADALGYDVVDLFDPGRGATYVVLRERAAPGELGYRALGFYAFRNDVRNRLIVEAPHPKAEIATETEGIDAFLEVGARALFVAGIHRNNSSVSSACTNGSYRISDAPHWTWSFFHVAHEAIMDLDAGAVAVQLHGYASPGSEQFILSEGHASDPSPNGFLRRLEAHLELDLGYQALVYPTETNRLGATWNVQGRYSNGESLDPCGRSATRSLGRFVSVEQILAVRLDPARVIRALAATTAEYWP